MFLFMMILKILFTIAMFLSQIYSLKFFIRKLIVNDKNFNVEKFAMIFTIKIFTLIIIFFIFNFLILKVMFYLY